MKRYQNWIVSAVIILSLAGNALAAENWPQYKYDSLRSGNAADRSVPGSLGLIAAVPMTDAIFTAPAVAEGRVYVVDGAGVAFCMDAKTLKVLWKRETRGGKANCNNVSSPAYLDGYLHFGTMAGDYYVLDAETGAVVKEMPCGEPIFSSPAVSNNRAYFATLGSRIYAVEPDGTVCWTWDYVKEKLKFEGDRWSGEEWLKRNEGKRVTWRDQFCCSRDVAMHGKMLVVPASGETVWLEDGGSAPILRGYGNIPEFKGKENPAIFGLSMDEAGAAYAQFHRRDNSGRVEILKMNGDKIESAGFVPGATTRNDMPGSLSFTSVSVRGDDVYRCRPEEDFGLARHTLGKPEPDKMGGFPSIAPPVLLRDSVVYGGLDGALYVVPMQGGKPRAFQTAFGKTISAPAAICDGRIYFTCEDGYLYALGADGKAALPTKDLELWKIRSPLTGKMAGPEYDWITNYGDLQSSNSNDQGLKPPFKIRWIRRSEGTLKHLPVCGGGRMYTHLAEGQVFAIEQETGRLLWRRYWPGVFNSFTSPLYWGDRLVIPQAGLKGDKMRCLDAATGELLWEAPFTGSPSWSRQQSPVVHKNLAIYMFGTGQYVPKGTGHYVMRQGKIDPLPDSTEGEMSWLYSHDNPYYPPEHKPMLRAWNLETGEVAWTKDFSMFGAGGDDAGVCLMDGALYYSCYFGYSARTRRGLRGPNGITAALDPQTGEIIWFTTAYSVAGGCTISARDGRLYLGGYNPPNERTEDRFVWCIDARAGSVIWKSEPLMGATNVVGIGEDFIFSHARAQFSYIIDKHTGKVLSNFSKAYYCTRFTCSEPYILGANMDIIDPRNNNELVSSGPAIDTRECLGATPSNGRLFYSSQASGLQTCQVCGEEAETLSAPWETAAKERAAGQPANETSTSRRMAAGETRP